MHKYFRTLMGTAAVAVLGVAVMATNQHYARAQDTPAKKDKAPKDTGEYDIYNEVIKDSNPLNAQKLLTDLNTWTQKYPATDFKDERTVYYVEGYAGASQLGKALDTAKDLFAGGLAGLKAGVNNSPTLILPALVYSTQSTTTLASGTGGTPTPDQLATGEKAANMLLEYVKEYFVASNKPPAMSDADWAKGRKDLENNANGALLQIALYPGTSQLKKDAKGALIPESCAAAEPAFVKAVQDHPDSGQVVLQLATVLRCQQTPATPAKSLQAIYEYARAASLPIGLPWGLDAANQKAFDDFVKNAYTRLHGSDEGLAELKELSLKSPLPPPDFKIKTAGEIALEKQKEFEQKNPQLSVWMGIKGGLANDPAFFEASLKETDVKGQNGAKALKGTIVGALVKGKPAPGMCRPDALLVAISLPDQTGAPVPEITLKLVDDQDKPVPLTGKVEAGEEIQWDGVPSAFTKEPFMLTMDTDKSKIEGLKTTPCAPAAPAVKKGGGAAPPPAKKKG